MTGPELIPEPLPYQVADAEAILLAYVEAPPRATGTGEAAKLACAVRAVLAGPGLAAGFAAVMPRRPDGAVPLVAGTAGYEGAEGLASRFANRRRKRWPGLVPAPAAVVTGERDRKRSYRVVTG